MLDEIYRQGAAKMLAVALEAEMADYVAQQAEDLDQDGHRLVVPTGTARRVR